MYTRLVHVLTLMSSILVTLTIYDGERPPVLLAIVWMFLVIQYLRSGDEPSV